jgi:hypothetical protein
MIPVDVSHGMPCCAANTAGGGAKQEVDGMAWRREMERVQSASWFKPWRNLTPHDDRDAVSQSRAEVSSTGSANALRESSSQAGFGGPPPEVTVSDWAAAATDGGHPPKGAPDLGGGTVGAVRPGGIRAQSLPASRLQERLGGAFTAAGPPALTFLAPGPAARPAQVDSAPEPMGTLRSPWPRNTARSDRLAKAVLCAVSPHEPVRLHVQWEDNAARVWLGVDSEAAQRLPELAQSLSRWLGGVGMRLRSLVCNGVMSFDRGKSPAPARLDRASMPLRGTVTTIDIVVEEES